MYLHYGSVIVMSYYHNIITLWCIKFKGLDWIHCVYIQISVYL